MNCCVRKDISPLIIHCGNGCVFSVLPAAFSVHIRAEKTRFLCFQGDRDEKR